MNNGDESEEEVEGSELEIERRANSCQSAAEMDCAAHNGKINMNN